MTLAGDIEGSLRVAACGLFAGYDNVARYANGLFTPDQIGNKYNPSGQAKVVNAGLALFCDRPPFQAPSPPFVGGQCPVDYSISATATSYVNNNLASQNFVGTLGYGFPGPIFSVKFTPDQRKFRVTNVAGLFDDFPSGSGPNGFELRDLRDITVTRRDGQLDNCGNPVVVYPPPGPGDTTTNITVNNSNGPVIFLPPILNLNGDLSIPFNFDIGEIALNGTLELNTGEINLNFGGQPTDPPIPKLPAPDGNTPPGDMDDPESEKLANIIGVIVISTRTTDLSVTEIPETVMPDIYIPRLADVSFQVRIGDKTHWTSDIPVKSRNAWIPLPGAISAIDVGVQSKRGWSNYFTPVRSIAPQVFKA